MNNQHWFVSYLFHTIHCAVLGENLKSLTLNITYYLNIGLQIVKSINIKKLEVEVDCQEIYKLINCEQNNFHHFPP